MPVITTSFGSFDFKPYAMTGTSWNDCAGVYLFVKPGASSFDVVYVGLCDSFKNRMCAHERWDEAVRSGATSVHAAHVPDKATREALEKYLIATHNPPLNTHYRTEGLASLLSRR